MLKKDSKRLLILQGLLNNDIQNKITKFVCQEVIVISWIL